MEEIKNELVASTPATPAIKKKAPVKKAEPIVKPLEVQPQAPVHIKEFNQEVPRELTLEEKRRQSREEAAARIRREWEIESQMVTGIFRDLEVGPGGHLRFSACKYPQFDPVAEFDFKDGHTYTVPLWVAKHLNEECKYPVYEHRVEHGASHGAKAKQLVGYWNHRFAFVSTDFVNLHKPAMPGIIQTFNTPMGHR